MRQQDVLAVLPTGYGKSILYQMIAAAKEKPVVVVSPLISLMKDQVEKLRTLGFNSCALGSLAGDDDDYLNPEWLVHQRVIYCPPEALVSWWEDGDVYEFINTHVALFAVDEAHCLEKWGVDFRTDYKTVQFVRTRFPHIPILALTATAPADIRERIAASLGMDLTKSHVVVMDPRRTNLLLNVRYDQYDRTKCPKTQVLDMIQSYHRRIKKRFPAIDEGILGISGVLPGRYAVFHAVSEDGTQSVKIGIRSENITQVLHPFLAPEMNGNPANNELMLKRGKIKILNEDRHPIDANEKGFRVWNTTPSTVVYTITKGNAEEIAKFLRERKLKADHFHGGLTIQQKNAVQNRFMSDETPIIVATSAFGMGVDKRNIRLIIRLGPDASLEEWLQGAGRAGRDGVDAICCLYSNPSLDHSARFTFVVQGDQDFQKARDEKFQVMKSYILATTDKERDKWIETYFKRPAKRHEKDQVGKELDIIMGTDQGLHVAQEKNAQWLQSFRDTEKMRSKRIKTAGSSSGGGPPDISGIDFSMYGGYNTYGMKQRLQDEDEEDEDDDDDDDDDDEDDEDEKVTSSRIRLDDDDDDDDDDNNDNNDNNGTVGHGQIVPPVAGQKRYASYSVQSAAKRLKGPAISLDSDDDA